MDPAGAGGYSGGMSTNPLTAAPPRIEDANLSNIPYVPMPLEDDGETDLDIIDLPFVQPPIIGIHRGRLIDGGTVQPIPLPEGFDDYDGDWDE